MAAFVVVDPAAPSRLPLTGARLGVFPGAVSPSVCSAGAPFWIGYGFVPESAAGADSPVLGPDTCFELTVDGDEIELVTDVEYVDGRCVHKLSVANFPKGLPAGW